MAKSPDPLALIADAAEEGTARSKHTRWMTRNHDELAGLVDQGVPWTRVTEAMVEAGLVPAGTKPSAIKRAWERVTARVAEKRTRKPPQPTAGKPTPAARPSSPDPTPAAPEPQQPSGAASKADEQIARLNEIWRAQKPKMPDPL
jgi:hypothetical protein